MKKIIYKITDTLTDEVQYMGASEFVEGKGIPVSAVNAACKEKYLVRHRYKVELSEVSHKRGEAFDRETRMLVCANYKNGMKLLDLAHMFHTTVDHIKRIVIEEGCFENRHKPVPADKVKVLWPDREIYDKGKLRALHEAGWSANKIADEFNTSEKKVIECLKEMTL